MEILKNAEISWVSIECLRRRQDPDGAEDIPDDTTIVLTVDEIPQLTDNLKAVLRDIYVLSGEMFVEIVQGQIWPYSGPKGGVRIEPPYQIPPAMGASIGVSGQPWFAGTLGGYVNLWKDKNDVTRYGLTCDHVLKPRTLGPSGRPETGNDSSIRVLHPSQADHEETITQIRRALERGQSQRDMMQASPMTSSGPDKSSDRAIRGQSFVIEKRRKQLDAITSANRQIGTVFSTSGIDLSREKLSKWGCRIDWGLVDLAKEQVGINQRPGESREILGAQPPEEGVPVTKVGRTTGKTRGTINGVKACIWNKGTSKESHSMEWTVVGDCFGGPFSLKGDSGSFVITCDEFVTGLLWGGQGAGPSKTTYFTPIDVVAGDILQATGYHVSLPRGEHLCC
ncbi:hypothetical protein FQN54_008760 [Arachnomyces sp. PD_36]|nr:hypothetical protein FQN54_008760 [Arachnomyces sp. PD_36]